MGIEIIQLIVPFAMFTLMFGMGLNLGIADFRRVLLLPRPTVVGLVLQLALLPAIGFGLAYLFALSPLLAVGLVVAAACPGGTMSNVVVHVGKGDTALSITLTATATAATLFTLPLWAELTLAYFGGGDASVELPILKTAGELGVFTVLPVILGMIARIYLPRLVKYESIISRLSIVAMAIAFVAAGIADDGDTLDKAGPVVIPSLILVVVAAVLGVVVPLMLGVSLRDSATVSVELCLKNVMLALFIATNSLQAIEAAYASAVLMIVMLPVAIAVMFFYNMVLKREAQAGGAAA